MSDDEPSVREFFSLNAHGSRHVDTNQPCSRRSAMPCRRHASRASAAQDPQGGEPTLVTLSRPCLRLRPDAGGCAPVIVQTGWRKRSISSVSIVGVGPMWVATMAPSAQAKSSASSGEAPLSSL